LGELKPRVLVSGANGFIGREVCRTLSREGFLVLCAGRRREIVQQEGFEYVQVGDIGPETDWSKALDGISAVVHLAARVHKMEDAGEEASIRYELVNTLGTVHLAEASLKAKVTRFLFLSTVKVSGEETFDTPFSEDAPPHPQDAYAISKWKAEQGIREIGRRDGLEAVIIRPPLAYGPGVRANFLRLMRLVDRAIPLPLGAVKNRRSLVGLQNLAFFIVSCLRRPEAAGNTFFVRDDEDISTAGLVRRMAQALGRRPRLIPAPVSVLKFAAGLAGKGGAVRRLTGSLQVDDRKARELLGWSPLFSMDEEMARTAQWYISTFRKRG
jgi:nucleoside-diphosphate-sugar epimerase